MAIRLKGHRLSVEWNGEHGAESGSTGTCSCGWSESASSQREVRREYRYHLATKMDQRNALLHRLSDGGGS